MRKYLFFAKTQILLVLSYRFELFTDWIGVIVRFLVMIGLWSLTTKDNQAEYQHLVLYFALITLLHNILTARTAGNIRKAIFSGDVNNTLIKPVNFLVFSTLQSTTRIFIKFFTPSIIFVIAAAILPAYFAPASFMSLVFFIVFTIIALVLWNFIMILIGLTTFWISENRSLITVVDLIFAFFMGGFMPAYYFPQSMQTILKLTPIYYLAAFPIDVYNGKFQEVFTATLILAIWFVLLYLLIKFTYHHGLRQYDANGA